MKKIINILEKKNQLTDSLHETICGAQDLDELELSVSINFFMEINHLRYLNSLNIARSTHLSKIQRRDR